MSYEMTVTLTDQEYHVLAVIRHLPSASTTKYAMTGREFAEKLYREGKLASLATQRPLTPEEQAERERLAHVFASDKLASEMVIEDRGPY